MHLLYVCVTHLFHYFFGEHRNISAHIFVLVYAFMIVRLILTWRT